MSIEVEQLKHRAKKAMQSGDAGKAADALNQLVLLMPDDMNYRHLAAELCKKAGRKEQAASHFWYLTNHYFHQQALEKALKVLNEYRQLQDMDKQEGQRMFDHCRAEGISIAQSLPFLHDDDRLVYAMRAHAMFDARDDALFEEARASSVLMTAQDQALVVEAGDAGDCLFIVTQGELRPVVTGEDGQSYQMAGYKPGSMTGEGAFLAQQQVRSATLMAVGDTQYYILPYTVLKQLSEKAPRFLEVMQEQQQVHGPERLLGRAPFFRDCSPELRREIAQQLEPVVLPADGVLFDYNERSDLDLYVIQSGLISVSVCDNGREQYLNTVKEGNVVGELGVPQNMRKFRAHAVSDARLLRWPEALYRPFYMQNSAIRSELLERQDAIQKKLRGFA